MRLGKDKDNPEILIMAQECLEGMIYDRLLIEQKELLRNAAPHPGTCAPGHDDGVFLHHCKEPAFGLLYEIKNETATANV
jgi:hypothetical protein